MMTIFTKFGFQEEDLKRPIATFSGGQKTRLAFVKLLLSKPDVLLLDEPTAMLDESARAEVMRILDDLQAQGTTIVHVTHHQDETVHADRIVHMESGQIVGIEAVSARPQTIANHPSPDKPHQPGGMWHSPYSRMLQTTTPQTPSSGFRM